MKTVIAVCTGNVGVRRLTPTYRATLRQHQTPTGTVVRQESASTGTTLRQNQPSTATGTVLREAPTPSDGTVLRQEPVSHPQQAVPKQQVPSSTVSWQIGATVLDEFRIEKILGRGGMGEVYLVADVRNKQRFAVKRTYLTQARHRDLFLRELQVWLDLPAYPHILPLRFLRAVGDEQLIFNDYMPGGSLESWLGTSKLGTLETVLDLAIQYAWGLHAVHELGHIHQDVKPANALLDSEGILKVADFGLTQAAGAGVTWEYCSPEQYRNEQLTRHTDQWSWGLTVLAMLVGKDPVAAGQNAATALEQYKRSPRQLALNLPAPVAAVLARCFQEQPTARWLSLQEAATALIKLHPHVCNKPYPRTQPAVVKASERLQVMHDRRSGNVQWKNPRDFLIEALQVAGRNPAEADQMIAAQASTRKGQAAGDLILYETAQQMFQELIAQGRSELRENLASLHWNKAFIYKYLDDPVGSMGAWEQAIAMLQRLIQEGRRELEPDLAKVFMNKGEALRNMGQLPAAVAMYDECIAIRRRLIEKEGRREQEPDLATVFMNKGLALWSMGQLPSAVAMYDESIAIYRRLVEKEGRRELEPELAKVFMNKGIALANMGQLPAAVAMYDESIAIYRRLVEKEGRRELEPELAKVFMNKGNALQDMGQLPAAVAMYDECIAIRRRLIETEGRRELEPDLADVFMNKGVALKNMGQLPAAVAMYDECIAIWRRLIETEGRRELEPDLATVFMNKGNALQSMGQLPAAVAMYDECIAIRRRLIEKEGRRELEPELANVFMNKGVALANMGQLPAAVAMFDECIAIQRRLIEKEGRRELEPDLAKVFMIKGVALYNMGQLPAAVAMYDESILIFRRLVEKQGRHDLEQYLNMAINNRKIATGTKS